MKKYLYFALALAALTLILAGQTWVSIDLTTGKNLEINGYEAYPILGSAVLADIAAIGLVLYLHRRWGYVFIVAGAVALVLTALAQLPVALWSDQSVVAGSIEKATGIATWVSQLESVVIARQTTFVGSSSWILLLAVAIVQLLAARELFRKTKAKLAVKRDYSSKTTEPRHDNQSLWSETNGD